jgi:hypothetical protein
MQPEDFRNDIQAELSEYKSNVVKGQGYSSPVYLVEDIEYEFADEDMQRLEVLINTNQLDKIEISYIVDALLLSENVLFTNEEYLEELEYYVIG